MTRRPFRLDAPPEALDDDPPVTELMTHRIVAIVPEADLAVALRLMDAHGVRHLPVLDGERCVGLVLETDVARLLAGGRPEPGVPRLRVADVCRTAPALEPAARRSAAARSMHAGGIDAVLVTDGDRLLGIVTATDLIRSLAADGGNR
ncbi:CBS domain-containing protein [Pseudonocardia abyssalis]|uniref:CBS domain-containing protein n=2 Tax=Pseudonocardia abyssalis TaxID=2792008 RepID=A0ABS6UPP9_9PSEU|nr:CBS domain-containing protein [Pseudonocardia abyssalis]MBW0133769.1 CBS domain-containing protein [Pseudonocardia abyssalis]